MPLEGGGENGSIMVGMFVSLCSASQKPLEREFFIPAWMASQEQQIDLAN